jgi:hypothetical protein
VVFVVLRPDCDSRFCGQASHFYLTGK